MPASERADAMKDVRADLSVSPSKTVSDPSPPRKAPALQTLEFVLGFLLIALSGFKFSSASSTELDPSWQMALGYFFERGFLAGVDYAFTYGPFGHFWSPYVTYYPSLTTLRLCWWLVFSGSLGIFVALCASRLPTRAERIGFVTTLSVLCAAFSYEVTYFTYICSGVSLLFSPPANLSGRTKFAVLSTGIVSALAFLSLTKLSVLIISVLGLTSVCAYYCFRRRFFLAANTLLCYTAVSLTLWVLAGQGMSNIDTFVRTTLEVAGGYSAGMSLEIADYYAWYFALAVCFFASLLTAIKTWMTNDKPLSLFSGGFVVVTLLLAVKASFVRTFGVWFFGFAFCAPFFILAAGPLVAKRRHVYLSAFLLYEIIVILGLLRLPGVIGERFFIAAERIAAQWVYGLADNVNGIINFQTRIEELDRTWRLAAQDSNLPAVRKYVGSHAIDLFPNEPARLILNGLNYQPRPAFQSYMAYTETLQDLNLQFYRSARAPRFVLFRTGTIDGRFPVGDDGRAIQFLLENYRPILREDEYILLKRNDSTAIHEGAEESLGIRAIPLNHAVDVPLHPNQGIRVRIKLKKTFFGQIFEALHPLPHVRLAVETETGQRVAGKLVPGIGESGILIAPLLLSTEDWADYLLGASMPRAKQMTIGLESALGRWTYDDQAEVEFYRLNLAPKVVEPEMRSSLRADYRRFFSPEPLELTTSGGRPEIVRLQGGRVLFLHAPSWIRFPLETQGTYRLHAEFGIMPGAESHAEPELRTDGVVFSFRIGDRNIAERAMRPVERVDDRGPASLTVEFKVENPSTLVAEAGIGRNANGNSDWSYWKTISVERIGD